MKKYLLIPLEKINNMLTYLESIEERLKNEGLSFSTTRGKYDVLVYIKHISDEVDILDIENTIDDAIDNVGGMIDERIITELTKNNYKFIKLKD